MQNTQSDSLFPCYSLLPWNVWQSPTSALIYMSVLPRKRVSASRCLAAGVSAVLLWLHTSGFQASCHDTYCNVFGYLTALRHVFTLLITSEHQMWRARYWRRHSVCYSGLFTTSPVVTTISFFNVLWPSDVASRSGPGSSALVLWFLLIWSSLICIYLPKSTLLTRCSPDWYENTLPKDCLFFFLCSLSCVRKYSVVSLHW
jgi:hypothetical protein